MCATVACHGQSSPQLLSQTRYLRSNDMRGTRETAWSSTSTINNTIYNTIYVKTVTYYVKSRVQLDIYCIINLTIIFQSMKNSHHWWQESKPNTKHQTSTHVKTVTSQKSSSFNWMITFGFDSFPFKIGVLMIFFFFCVQKVTSGRNTGGKLTKIRG